jgi:hypothetical protein
MSFVYVELMKNFETALNDNTWSFTRIVIVVPPSSDFSTLGFTSSLDIFQTEAGKGMKRKVLSLFAQFQNFFFSPFRKELAPKKLTYKVIFGQTKRSCATSHTMSSEDVKPKVKQS